MLFDNTGKYWLLETTELKCFIVCTYPSISSHRADDKPTLLTMISAKSWTIASLAVLASFGSVAAQTSENTTIAVAEGQGCAMMVFFRALLPTEGDASTVSYYPRFAVPICAGRPAVSTASPSQDIVAALYTNLLPVDDTSTAFKDYDVCTFAPPKIIVNPDFNKYGGTDPDTEPIKYDGTDYL